MSRSLQSPTQRRDRRELGIPVATSVWNESPREGGPMKDHPETAAESTEAHLKRMRLVREFVSQLIEEQGGDAAPALSDEEWSRLCDAAGDADSDETAVARIVLGAYGVTADRSRPEVTERIPTPLPVAPEMPLVSRTASGQLPPWPVPVDGSVQPLGSIVPVPVPVSPLDPMPVSFSGTAWQVLDHPAATHSQPAPSVPTLAPDPIAPIQSGHGLGIATDLMPTEPIVTPQPDVPPAGIDQVEAWPTRRRAHTRQRGRIMEDRRRERLLSLASWVRNFGAIILLFVAWQLWGTAITQHHAENTLEHQFAAQVHHAPVKAAPGFTLTPATTSIPDPPQGTVMAHLQIPKISLDQYVVSGTAEADLAKGPGHYLGTAMPGQAGNVAIAGHRTTHGAPFNRLAELAIGDPIYLTTSSGQTLTYIVSAVPVAVSPSDVTVLNNFGDDRLTLTTCNPEYSAVQRLIVVAAYLPPGATHPVAIAKGTGKSYKLAPAETSGWDTTLLPLVAIEVLALAGLGLAFRRLSRVYGRGGRWLILGPVWLALLLALFETLTNFLPAAV